MLFLGWNQTWQHWGTPLWQWFWSRWSPAPSANWCSTAGRGEGWRKRQHLPEVRKDCGRIQNSTTSGPLKIPLSVDIRYLPSTFHDNFSKSKLLQLQSGSLLVLACCLHSYQLGELIWQNANLVTRFTCSYIYTLKYGFDNSRTGVSLALGKWGMHCWASDGGGNHRRFGWYPHSETSRVFSHICFKNNTEPFPQSSVGRYFETDLPNTLKKCNCTDSERRYKDLLVFCYKVNIGLKYVSICPKPNNLRAEPECSLKNFRVVLR